MLKYPPFAASLRLQAAARNHNALAMHERGPAIAIFQGGLVQMGYAMPLTMRKGSPDGTYGNETYKAVKAFQTDNHIVLKDGIAGRDTITLLDGMLAAAAGMTFPVPLGPPSTPVNPDYELGTGDPKHGHDPGAGVWDSSPTELSYVAMKTAVQEGLPEFAVIIGPNAAAHMGHYLGNSGRAYTIDLPGMVRDVPSAMVRYLNEIAEAQDFCETLPPGTFQIRSKMAEVGYNQQKENKDWFFAIGGYSSWGTGTVTVSGDAANRAYALDFEYKFYDRYNWDGGKSVTFHGIKVTDHFMGEFHRQGIAQEFDCFGSFKKTLTWKKGASISPSQLTPPTGRGS